MCERAGDKKSKKGGLDRRLSLRGQTDAYSRTSPDARADFGHVAAVGSGKCGFPRCNANRARAVRIARHGAAVRERMTSVTYVVGSSYLQFAQRF